MLDLPIWVWLATVGALAAVLAVDLLLGVRRPHEPSLREAAISVGIYVALAAAFAAGLWLVAGTGPGTAFVAGYLTEYSLSVDNLFVFVIILSRFAVPTAFQQKALLYGVVGALIARGAFIAIGAAAISRFIATFYVFGVFLLYTAVQLVRHRDEEPDVGDSRAMRLVRRVLPTTDEYDGARLTTRRSGRRAATPLLLVVVTLGATDVLFALDSIPAIFGLTKDPYIVFVSNAFALLGLRELYFLLRGLLDRLVYLSYGLAVVLAFIGAKLILEALHHSVPAAPEISTTLSLGVIVGVLAVTTVASLIRDRHARRTGDREVAAAR